VLEHKISDDTSYQQELLLVSIHKGNDIFYVVLEKKVSESLKNTEENLFKDEKYSSNFKMSLRTSRKEVKEALFKAAEERKKMKLCGDYGKKRDEDFVF
jgi:hypothetical protein